MASKVYKTNKILLPLALTIVLFVFVPLLIMAMTQSTENRSKASYTACSTLSPCVGTVLPSSAGVYKFVAADGVTYIIKSLRFNVSTYVNRRIAVTGNILSGNPPVLYADQVVPIPTPTPIIRPTPTSIPTPMYRPTPIPTRFIIPTPIPTRIIRPTPFLMPGQY